MDKKKKRNIIIIGAGPGGEALIEMLHHGPTVNILAVVDVKTDAPGIMLAQKFGIPTYTDFKEIITKGGIDEIINVTGSDQVQARITELSPKGVEIIGSHSAKLFWDIIEEHSRTVEEIIRVRMGYQELVENLNVGVYRNTSGKNGHFIEANNAIIKMFEADSKEEFLSHNVSDLYADASKRKEFSDKMLEKGVLKNEELELKTLKGKKFWGAVTAVMKKDEEGNIFFDGIIEDITARKETDFALMESRRRLADIIEFLPDATFVIDAEGKVIAWNRAIENMTGVKTKEMLGKGDHEYAIPFYGERRPILIDLVLKSKEEVLSKYSHLQRDSDLLNGEGRITNIGKDVLHFIGHAAALRDSRGNIVGAIETIRDVTERKHFEEELTKAKSSAETANQAKSEFLANMSHELRTPLNAIIGFSEVLQDESFGKLNDKQKEYQKDVLDSGKHLLALINDILDLSKIESGKVELFLSVFSLEDLFKQSIILIKEKAFNHSIQLSIDIEPDVKNIVADQRKVKQIVFNLLSNAIKFTPDKGKIGIRAKKIGEDIETAVWDTGIGIAKDQQNRLFEDFVQLENPYTKMHQGTGLGLALTRKLVELHGGKIRVESEGINQGTVFTFTLPARPTPSKTPEETKPAKKKALVIEDEPKNFKLAKDLLELDGWEVFGAAEGYEGIKLAKEKLPDLIVIDFRLPDIDGVEVQKRLCEDEKTKNIKMVFLTASVTTEEKKQMEATNYPVMEKPVNTRTFAKEIDKMFGGQE
ncbi:MAG: ATP-binding protein [Candidatus Omnitrophota bacterium]